LTQKKTVEPFLGSCQEVRKALARNQRRVVENKECIWNFSPIDFYKTRQKETPSFITSSIVALLFHFSWCCVLEYMVCFEILTEVGEVSAKQNILTL